MPHFCFFYFFPWMCSTTAFQWNNLQQCDVKDHGSHLCNPPPKQLHADWGQMKWAASFDFNWKTKLRQRELRFPVLSVLPSETEKDLRFQSHTQPQPQPQRLLTPVGVQNLPAPSMVAEWIRHTRCTQADVSREELGLISLELPELEEKKKYSLLAINSNIW